MASENAKKVAKIVSENLRDGKKVILGEIIRESGYAISTSEKPKLVTETDSYKEAIAPVVDKMIQERDRIIASISTKDLTEEKHKDLIDSLDKLTKNIQLLSGGKTENVGLETDRKVLQEIIQSIRG